ncbi:MAG: ABC transporter permease [Lachnospiraceae bacterium]|nr:ABC transporter permease [Lachnospiraceae bacterium]
MIRYILKRLLLMLPVLIGVTIMIFTIMYFTPGDPATNILGSNATPEQIEAKKEELGLNAPYPVRLGNYMKDVFFHFDFGHSYINGRSVSEDILSRYPATFTVAFLSIALALCIGVPLGVIAATHQNRIGDYVAMLISLFGVSMPNFWVGLMLVILFALNLGWLPGTGIGGPKYYILPCIACALNGIASLARQTRSSMLEVIRSDYIVTARSKGQTERKVIYRHALTNALIPVVTSAAGAFGSLLGGALVIETVFAIPGLGTYMVSAINNRDYPAIQGSVFFVALTFSLVMLLVDLIYAFIDPRIKAQYQGKVRIKK